jgi:environmental stress-induced protein Ves
MKAAHLTARDFTRQPWKNGGGSTTQLAVEGDGERWLWRVSVADVEGSGPFSDFAGYERTIMLVEGEGMALDIDGKSITLDLPFEPFVFDGGARTTCTLTGGRVRDLNLMVDRARARGTIDVIDPNIVPGVRIEAAWALVYALRGGTRITMDGLDVPLAPGELLRLDEAAGAELGLVSLDHTALVALIRIQPT